MQNQEWNVQVGLGAVVVSVRQGLACVLTVGSEDERLPFGAFDPCEHRTLELALRNWVDEQTGLRLGYVEQLYTFGNRHRDPKLVQDRTRLITVGYLALVGQNSQPQEPLSRWTNWYEFLPWEDHRPGRPKAIDDIILPQLELWADQAESIQERELREERIRLAFGYGKVSWDPEKVLPRYELLYEAGLVAESHRDWNAYSDGEKSELPITRKDMNDESLGSIARSLGRRMEQDHRRILASSMGRLRGKIKYRPVVFELVPPEFTLLQIQKVVEALSGVTLHKQNFRRLLLQGGLVKETEEKDSSTNGRPASLFRFRKSVLLERPVPGIGLPQVKA